MTPLHGAGGGCVEWNLNGWIPNIQRADQRIFKAHAPTPLTPYVANSNAPRRPEAMTPRTPTDSTGRIRPISVMTRRGAVTLSIACAAAVRTPIPGVLAIRGARLHRVTRRGVGGVDGAWGFGDAGASTSLTR